MKKKGRSLSFGWYSLDDALCVPLTTYQQRITGTRYLEDMVVFFEKGTEIESIIPIQSRRFYVKDTEGKMTLSDIG